MNDYIEQLEKDNEKLREDLAEAHRLIDSPPLKLLSDNLRKDFEIIHIYYCNMIYPIQDTIQCSHFKAQQAASEILRRFFDVGPEEFMREDELKKYNKHLKIQNKRLEKKYS